MGAKQSVPSDTKIVATEAAPAAVCPVRSEKGKEIDKVPAQSECPVSESTRKRYRNSKVIHE